MGTPLRLVYNNHADAAPQHSIHHPCCCDGPFRSYGLVLGHRTPQDQPTTSEQTNKGQQELTTADHPVGDSKLQCITTNFMSSIHHGTAVDHKPIGSRYMLLRVKVGSLQDVVSQVANAATGQPKQDPYVQGVVWVPVGIAIDNPVVSGTPYKNKAANPGAPCPVHCPGRAFVFPVNGTDGCL